MTASMQRQCYQKGNTGTEMGGLPVLSGGGAAHRFAAAGPAQLAPQLNSGSGLEAFGSRALGAVQLFHPTFTSSTHLTSLVDSFLS